MRHILVIEDDLAVCRMLTEALEEDGRYRVNSAQFLAEARMKIGTDRPDTVVIDMLLPDGSGLDFARELASQDVSVLVLARHPKTIAKRAPVGLPCLPEPSRVREFIMWLSDVDGRAAIHATPT